MKSKHVSIFELDRDRQQLRWGEQVVPLRSRTFAVLQLLAARRGEVVRKEELFAAVWPGAEVTDEVLTVCISELRKALRDQDRHLIQTVHRKGYRLSLAVAEQAASPLELASDGPPLVGREPELDRLHQALRQALAGKRQLAFVSGEAGMGKTALIEHFLRQATTHAPFLVGRGQCVSQHGPGEPFLPLLEALSRLALEQPRGAQLTAVLRRHAPSWLLQLPGLVDADELESLRRRHGDATRQRMLRQLGEALEALSAAVPLVLVLEDLHWSDDSTLDFLGALAARGETRANTRFAPTLNGGAARVFVVATYRPVEAILAAHSLRATESDLGRRGLCFTLPLELLSADAVNRYVTTQIPDRATPTAAPAPAATDLARIIYRHTSGHPFFMAVATAHLRDRSRVADDENSPADLASAVPEGLRQTIALQLDALAPDQLHILEAASAVGLEFASQTVAAAAHLDEVVVVACCDALAARRHPLEARGVSTWPDGSTGKRYRFVHELYREVLYERVGRVFRRRLHQRIAQQIEAAHGGRNAEVAGELAGHFERAGDEPRARDYHSLAGSLALGRGAFREAVHHLDAALDIVARTATIPERSQREIALLTLIGVARMNLEGFAAPAVERTFARAHGLCRKSEPTPELFTVVEGLHSFYAVRGDLRKAFEHARRLEQFAAGTGDPGHRLEAHHVMGSSFLRRGDFGAARNHLQTLLGLAAAHEPAQARAYSGHDPKACALGHLALTAWLQGRPEEARRHAEAALVRGEEVEHPFSLALAQCYAGLTLLLRRDGKRTLAVADAMLALSLDQELPFWQSIANFLRGAALAQCGGGAEALETARRGCEAYHAAGGGQIEQHWLLAATCHQVGAVDEGLDAVARALMALRAHGERYPAPELHRLEGELRLLRNPRDRGGKAMECFSTALRLARRMGSASFALRAALSAGRLFGQRRDTAAGRRLVAAAHAPFREGFDTADLREAAQILETGPHAASE